MMADFGMLTPNFARMSALIRSFIANAETLAMPVSSIKDCDHRESRAAKAARSARRASAAATAAATWTARAAQAANAGVV